MSPRQIRIRESDDAALAKAAENHQSDAVVILRSLIAHANELMWVLKLLRMADDDARTERIVLAVRALTARSPGERAALHNAARALDARLNDDASHDALADARAALANLAIIGLVERK